MLSASPEPAGLIDTSVFVHAATTDVQSAACRQFLTALERGALEARLEPPVLHELSYALPHYLKQITRSELVEYLLTVLSWPGVRADKALLVDAVQRWRDTPQLAFVDAYLAAIANRDGSPIYTKNVAELAGQGVSVAPMLPPTAAPT